MKGKLPYRDFETFDGPPNPFLLAVVYYTGGIGLTPERAPGFAYRLIFLGAMFCLARRWNSTVASGCTLFAALFLVSLGVAAYAWTGRLACALCSIYLLAQAESRQCGRGRCQWRASLPCGFWSRRNVVSITGFLAIPRREKLWYLFGAAADMLQLRPATYFSQSTRFTSPRRYRSGGLARSRPEFRMSGTNQMRPASLARMHQTKWCDLDLRFAARTEPTCSAVAGKMEAKVTASGAGLVACF